MHRYHLHQIAALCDAHPVDEKLVFVPSRQVGHDLGNSLSRAGTTWINLRLTTLAAWAASRFEPRLLQEGWRPLVHEADVFFVEELLASMRWPIDHPLSALRSTGRIARTFVQTIQALRSAGMRPGDLGNAREGIRYLNVVRSVYEGYLDWMDRERLYDDVRLLEEVLRDGETPPGDVVVAVLDETPLSALALEVVRGLSKGRLLRIGRASYGVPHPQHSAASRFPDATFPGVPPERSVGSPGTSGLTLVAESSRFQSLTGMIGPGGLLLESGLRPADAESLRLREAIGVENEVRGVLRELVESETPVDQVEIAYTVEKPYHSLLVAATERLGLQATFAVGVPIHLTASGQSLLSFYRWIATGYDPVELVRAGRSQLLKLDAFEGVEGFEIARVLIDTRVGRGRLSYARALDRASTRLGDRPGSTRLNGKPESEKARARRMVAVRRVLDALCELCPNGGTTTVRAMTDAGREFLSAFAPIRTDRDRLVIESLNERLEELGALVRLEGRPEEIAGRLADLLAEHKVEASAARGGHLHVVPLERAGYAGRRYLYVVGLDEASFPGSPSEDPILLDDERATLSGRLVLQRAQASDSVWHLMRALGMTSGSATLVALRRDLAECRDVFPAAVFEEARVQLGIRQAVKFPIVPDAASALDMGELALALRSSPEVAEQVQRSLPALQAGQAAAAARLAPELGRFSGWLGRRTPELRPSEREPLSASRLEELAACPYRYFLKRVLGIRPPDEPENRPGQWLAANEFGSLLHEVFREFMRELSLRDEHVDVERHAADLDRILKEKVAEYERRIPVEFDAAFRADVRRLERAAGIFLNEEASRDAEPVGFEVSFGYGQSDGLSTPDPIELTLSEDVSLQLVGSVDRIDRRGDQFEVWDYKTGSIQDFDETNLLTGGRRLQWALYAYVVETLLNLREGGSVARSGYFFTSDREHGLRFAEQPPLKKRLGAFLKPLIEMAEEGAFLHVQKSMACRFCDFRSICGSERRTRGSLDASLDATSSERGFLGALEEWMS